MTLVHWLQNYNGAVVAAATVALLLVTCIYVLLTGRMLRAAQRQADAAWLQVQDTRAAEILAQLRRRNVLGTRAGQLLFKLRTLQQSEPPMRAQDPVLPPWTERDLTALEVTAEGYNPDLLALASDTTECLRRLSDVLLFVRDQSSAEPSGRPLPQQQILTWRENYVAAEQGLDELHAIANQPGAASGDFAKLRSLQSPLRSR